MNNIFLMSLRLMHQVNAFAGKKKRRIIKVMAAYRLTPNALRCSTLSMASHKEGKEKERKRIALFAACGRGQSSEAMTGESTRRFAKHAKFSIFDLCLTLSIYAAICGDNKPQP